MEKLNIFLMGVGRKDPFLKYKSQTPREYFPQKDTDFGPILWFFKDLDKEEYLRVPFRVYLLPSAKVPGAQDFTEPRGRGTEEYLEELFQGRGLNDYEIYVWPLRVEDPTDYQQLYPELSQVVEGIKREAGDYETTYFVNPNPGVPQLTHVMISLVGVGLINPVFIERTPPRYKGRFREQDISFIFNAGHISRIWDLLKGHFYSSCYYAVLKLQNTLFGEEGRKGEILAALMSAYASWDNLEYKKAYKDIEALAKASDIGSYEVYRDLRALLAKQQGVLRKLVEESFCEERVIDLWQRAYRRLLREQYAESVLHCAILIEQGVWNKVAEVLNQKYARKYANPIESTEKINQALPPIQSGLAKERNRVEGKSEKAGDDYKRLVEIYEAEREISYVQSQLAGRKQGETYYSDGMEILKRIWPDFATELQSSLGQKLEGIRELRNKILHHAYSPRPDEAEESLGGAKDFIRKVYPGNDIEGYCFSPKGVEQAVQGLFPRPRPCAP